MITLSSDRTKNHRHLPWWKKLTFSITTTVLFFAALEGGLALLGFEATSDLSDPYVGFAGSSPVFVPDPDDAFRIVTASNKLAWFNKQSFARIKPHNTRRVFCLGGSTTYGRPYDDTTSFAGWLRELLPELSPDTDWEVINAGGVSYASYRVARMTRELEQYEPDYLVVYTGHNEFLEERTYGDLKQVPALQRTLEGAVAQTRIGMLARRVFFEQTTRPPGDRHLLPDDVDTILDHSVGPTSYHRDDAQREKILRHFEVNLNRIVAIGRNAGAEVVLVTPAANLKGCSPFKSEHADGLTAETIRNWTRHYQQAQRLDREGKQQSALEAYRRAERLDPRYAELHWRIGRVLHRLERYDESHAAFLRAVDEDVCPLRAVSEIAPIMRRVAKRLHVRIVDFELLVTQRCEAESGQRSPGHEYFLDHVHPTIPMNGHLAEAIAMSLDVEASEQSRQQLLTEVGERINSRIDVRQHAIALRNLAKVLNWSGKHLEAGTLALRAVEQLPDDPEALVISAAYLAQTGRLDQAIDHYRRALKNRTNYAIAHQMIGAALVDRGDLDEALAHFNALARLRPDDADAWHMIGAILGEQHRFEEAVPYYEKALKLNPDDSHLHYNLANSLGHLALREDAMRHYMRAISLNPEDADAHNNLGVMLLKAGRNKEAAVRFREVLRIRPDDGSAEQSLKDAERNGDKLTPEPNN